MRVIFEPLKRLTVEQLDRIDPWDCWRYRDGPGTLADRCIFQQALECDAGEIWDFDIHGVDDLARQWDNGWIPRQELADAIAECKERLRVPVFEEVELV